MNSHWEKEILLADLVTDKVISLDRGRVISSIDLYKKQGVYPVYSSSAQKNGLFGHFSEYDFDEEMITWSVDGGGYFFYRPKHKFSVTNVAGLLRILKPDYDYKFLFYCLDYQHSNQIYDYVDKAHPSVIKKRYFIPDISISEQQKIAEILTKMDDAIANTQAMIDKYENIKKGLMQDLLTKGIDENGNIRSEETHKFKDSPLGRIPVEWEVVTIDKIAEKLRSGVTPRGGSSVYSKEGVLFLRSQNIYPNRFKLDDVAFISENINNSMLGSEIQEFDVLLNITGASIGRCTYVPKNFRKANVNQHVCFIRLKDTDYDKSFFLSNFLNSPYGQNQIMQNNAGGNREGINYKLIKSIVLPWFRSTRELSQFRMIIEKMENHIRIQQQTLTKLKNRKKGMMADLLSGKIKTSNFI